LRAPRSGDLPPGARVGRAVGIEPPWHLHTPSGLNRPNKKKLNAITTTAVFSPKPNPLNIKKK
ncbi:hypothetical protein ACVGWG_05475, partial [Enterobacter asburiae]